MITPGSTGLISDGAKGQLVKDKGGLDGDTSAVATRQNFWRECLRLRPSLIRVARRQGVSPAEAEDVVHDAFLRAAQYTQLDPGRLMPFLVAVVKRLCVDELRRRASAQQVCTHPRLLPMQVIDPADVVTDRHEARWLLARCGKLSQREWLVLLWLDQGLPHEEISRLLGTTRRATECIASRARCRVRRWMARRLRSAGERAGY